MSSPTALAEVDQALSEHFSEQPRRASISFVGVEPISVLRFEPVPGELVYISLGMSQRPMSSASDSTVDPSGPRAELAFTVLESPGRFQDVWRQLAVLAAAPVVEGVVYVAGMTVDLGQPIAKGSRCTGAVTSSSALGPIETVAGPVEVFELVPATSTELAWARVHGTDALRGLWVSHATEVRDLARLPVELGS